MDGIAASVTSNAVNSVNKASAIQARENAILVFRDVTEIFAKRVSPDPLALLVLQTPGINLRLGILWQDMALVYLGINRKYCNNSTPRSDLSLTGAKAGLMQLEALIVWPVLLLFIGNRF